MRCRHRHISPISAGATFAWDTRFNKDSLTDGSAVATWTDRGGSTATQGTTANKPAWKNNSTDNINGVPVVQFDGSNDSISTASTTSATAVSCVSVCKRNWQTLKFCPIVASNYGATTGVAFLTTAGGTYNDWLSGDFLLFGNGYNSGRNPRAAGPPASTLTNGTAQVLSGVLSSGASRVWLGGSRISTRVEGTASVPGSSAAVFVGGNPGTSDFGDLSFAIVAYWRTTGLTDSLRRRMEHAAAYSCKVPAA